MSGQRGLGDSFEVCGREDLGSVDGCCGDWWAGVRWVGCAVVCAVVRSRPLREDGAGGQVPASCAGDTSIVWSPRDSGGPWLGMFWQDGMHTIQCPILSAEAYRPFAVAVRSSSPRTLRVIADRAASTRTTGLGQHASPASPTSRNGYTPHHTPKTKAAVVFAPATSRRGAPCECDMHHTTPTEPRGPAVCV